LRILRVIYVLAIGTALIALVIAGMHAFYPVPTYGTAYSTGLHARNVFLIALPLGVVFAVVGAFIQRRTNVFGAGLIVGGMGTMIFALTGYGLDDILVFVGIAIILAVLIVGYRLFSHLRRT
jgi:hypothetical protein